MPATNTMCVGSGTEKICTVSPLGRFHDLFCTGAAHVPASDQPSDALRLVTRTLYNWLPTKAAPDVYVWGRVKETVVLVVFHRTRLLSPVVKDGSIKLGPDSKTVETFVEPEVIVHRLEAAKSPSPTVAAFVMARPVTPAKYVRLGVVGVTKVLRLVVLMLPRVYRVI